MSSLSDTIRVLHVDDEPGLADMAGTYIEREDDRLSVDAAESASDARDHLDDADYECIVSDYDMPGQNGIEFLETVRADYPDLPFILYTGKGSEEVASDAIAAGVTDYLQKETGTSQYTVLANRITNAVEQYRSSHRATELERIRTLSSDINRALVRAESQAEIKTRVCEIISNSDPYRFAWIGNVDSETNRIEAQVSAGMEEGYLDDITITPDESPTGQGPGGTAIRERRIAVSQQIDEDPEFEPWREQALERGFRAVAAVPLEYRDTLYGELVVYADRSNAFDETERDLLADLGGDIAHVLHSFDVRATLREERDFIEQALDSLDDIFYVVNTDGTLRRWNDQLVAVTGYTNDELAEMQTTDLFSDGEQGRVTEAIDETLTTGQATVESEVLTADGDRLPYEFTGSRLTDLDGNLVGVIGIGRDITERKHREHRVQRLIDTLPGMVYRCRNDQGWPMENLRGNVQELTGYPPSELERRDGIYGDQIIHPDDQENVWTAVQDALDDHESFEITYRIRTRDGETRWVWERGKGVYSDAGDVAALEGFVTDITERERQRQAIDTLHETARSILRADTAEDVAEITVNALRDVLDMPWNGFHLYDEDAGGLVPVAWSDRTEEIVGEPPTFAPGEGLAGRAFETGEPLSYDDISTVPERFNPDTPIRSQIVFPLDDHGVLVIGSPDADAFDVMDVSLVEVVARHTTTALNRIAGEQERQLMDQIIQQMNDGAVIVQAGSLEYTNPALSELTGYSKETLMGRPMGEFIAPEYRERVQQRHRARVAGDDNLPEMYEIELLSKDGAWRPVELNVSPIEYKGEPATLSLIRDVSERREHERALERKNDRLDRFASVVSHDLRNPLTVAQGRLELARESSPSEHLDEMAWALDRMDALIDDLLGLARQGEDLSEVEPVEVASLAADCWRNVAMGEATLTVDVERTIQADESRLQQLVENLLRNAVEHGGEGVAVTIGGLEDGFYVEDDGPGIPEENREDVSEAGYSTSEEGTGFGLSIVKEVADAHGWEITVTDGSDGGARFEITGVESATE